MLCDECKKNQANFSYSIIDSDGSMEEKHICYECLQKAMEKEGLGPWFYDPNVMNIMQGIFALFSSALEEEGESELICPDCGATYEEFKQSSLLGCATCYQTFKEELYPLINRIQGDTVHVGEVGDMPSNLEQDSTEIERELELLKISLEDAISEERYEEAAVIRDQIKELEG